MCDLSILLLFSGVRPAMDGSGWGAVMVSILCVCGGGEGGGAGLLWISGVEM